MFGWRLRLPFLIVAGALMSLGVAHAASPSDDTLSIQLMILGLCLTPVIYFLPSVLAATRDHPAANGVFAVNLFLGWTVVGWVVALTWVLMAANRRPSRMAVEVTNPVPSITPMLALVDVAAQEIEELTRQKLQLLITEDEYNQRKQVILDRWRAVPVPPVSAGL